MNLQVIEDGGLTMLFLLDFCGPENDGAVEP
jgi:hypothetical protein